MENVPLSRYALELVEGQHEYTVLQASAGVTSTGSFRSVSSTAGST